MASPETERILADVRKLQLQMQESYSGIARLGAAFNGISSAVNALQNANIQTPTSPVSNLLWNGELGHSVNSWHDSAYVTTDKAKECAWFFSNYLPFSGFNFTTIATNNEIPWPIATVPLPEDGTAIRLTNTGGALPSGGGSPIAAATTYYTVVATANTIRLASTEALALAATPDKTFNAGTGTGTHRICQQLDSTDARTSSNNKALKATSHSTYSPLFAKWDSSRGEAQICGTRTLETPLPANLVDATLANLYISFILAKRNAYISIPSDLLLGVGIWDATGGQGDWLRGSIGFDAEASVEVGTTTLERRYRIYVETDRGYSMISDEIVVLDAPDDGEYDANNFVTLSWRPVQGYLNVEIYAYTPSTGVYRLLEEISSGASTFIDNGAFLDVVGGYPTATQSERKAVFFSREGEMRSEVGVDGSPWRTYFAPVPIPDNYDKSLTTDRQWLRIFQSDACDLVVPGITTDGSNTIVSTLTGVFESAYDAEFDGLGIFVYDEDGVELVDTNISNRVDDETLVLDTSVAAGTDRIIKIVGGGFHGLLIDKIHAGYQRNVSFAHNPLDVRTLQPVAAPTGSSQGGPGDGDDPGGGVVCVADDTPIELAAKDGYASIEAGFISAGYNVEGEMLQPNIVRGVIRGKARVRLVRTKNGFEKEVTSTHRFRMSKWDERGSSLAILAVGEYVYTNINGRDELSPIVYIGPLSKEEKWVINPLLAGPGHYYRAGRWKPKWWQKILIKLRLMKPKTGGIYAHNRKRDDFDLTGF